jgi:GTPase SAR1 family protein
VSAPPATINLSLMSHTNAGKTTLARTLLREDIGEVSDRPHVTEFAESHVLIQSPAGDTLVLWDTPGFGDSVRLLKRLKQSENPFGWFLTQVWDRFADRPFWCSQQAMRHAREQSDVLLYVVNASEHPAEARYVDAEMQILGWIDKPIVLLLNQLGPPRHDGRTQADVELWRMHLSSHPQMRVVLPFDAFARCWVQEGTLLRHIASTLGPEQQEAFERIIEAWRARNLEVFDQSMQILARQVAAAATDVERLPEHSIQARARAWIGEVATGIQPADAQLQRAQTALAGRLDSDVRAATEKLVALHGLTGKATQEVLQRMGREFAVERPTDADKAGVIGGLVSGALGGLAADLAAGGLTFGAGALLGGVLGAFGARSLTKAYNLARGADTGTVRWSSEFLEQRVAAALIRYLAVAHFGRGRGEFVTGAVPQHWSEAVAQALSSCREQLEEAWVQARSGASTEEVAARLAPVFSQSARDVLIRLYPDSEGVWM